MCFGKYGVMHISIHVKWSFPTVLVYPTSKYVTSFDSYVHFKKWGAILSDPNCLGSWSYLVVIPRVLFFKNFVKFCNMHIIWIRILCLFFVKCFYISRPIVWNKCFQESSYFHCTKKTPLFRIVLSSTYVRSLGFVTSF